MMSSDSSLATADGTGAANAGRRRHLVIVFSDLCDSTSVAAMLEPEVYVELLERLRRRLVEIVAQHGGEIVRIDGDGVIFVFGYPEAYEDAGRRATEAALDLHAAIDELDIMHAGRRVKLNLHTGIHSGVVLIRKGDLARGRFEILGDPTNVTARLCDFAAAGEIIVSEATLGADQHFFHVEQPRYIQIRGKAERLLIRQVNGRVKTPNRYAARMQHGAAPFAGRKTELAALRRHSQEASSSETSATALAIVTGEAGIGKTRFITEFLNGAAIDGFSVHQGFCESYLGARPLQPFAQLALSLLRTEFGLPYEADADVVADVISKIDPDLTAPMLHLLSMSDVRAERATRKIDEAVMAFLGVLNAVSTDKPVILCIDDWQWADNASARVLEQILEHARISVFIVLASRSVDEIAASMANAVRIELSPLAEDEAQDAIERLLRSPAPFVVERIKELSGGSPLFIEELCHSAQQHNAPEKGIESATLQSLIHSRFTRLPPLEATLVKIASVIGRNAPNWLLQSVSGSDFNAASIASLGESDFLHAGEVSGTLRFKHGVTRDVVYESISLSERKSIHSRIVEAVHKRAETSSEEEFFELLAFHYEQGGNSERAIHYSIRAGEKALAASALDRAQAHFRAALQRLTEIRRDSETMKLKNDVLRKYGMACVVDPSTDQLPILKSAANDAAAVNDLEGLAWAEYWLGFILYGLGRPKPSIDHFRAARHAAETLGDDKLGVQIQANLGQSHAAAGQYEAASQLLDNAISVKRKHRSGARASIGLSYSISCKAFVVADQGRFEDAHQQYGEAIKTLSGIEHEVTASILTQQSAVYLWQAEPEKAIDCARQALEISERVKARYLFAMSLSLLNAAALMERRDDDALADLAEKTEWLLASESQQFISLNCGWLAAHYANIGDEHRARRHAAHSVMRARNGDRLGEAMAFRAVARIAAASENSDRAKHYLARAYHISDFRNSRHELAKTQICHAEIASAFDEHARARDLTTRAFENLTACGVTWPTTEDGVVTPSSNRALL